MASPSPANALPRFSVRRLMNSDWVNSRLDGTCGTQSSSQVEKKRDEIKTLRDKRWDFALGIKVKLGRLSPRILLSPSVFSLFVFASLHTPDSSRLPHFLTHVSTFISHSYNSSLCLSPPAACISLSSHPSVSVSPQKHFPISLQHPLCFLLSYITLASLPRPARSQGQVH